MSKVYRGEILELKNNEIFVFGSNTQGRHGKGSALFAKNKCGAIYGQAGGPQGQSYGIVTKDISKYPYKQISKESIINQISKLYIYANLNPEKDFIIAYKGYGNNLNGYTPEEMSLMFKSYPIPNNIVFEETFNSLIENNESEN